MSEPTNSYIKSALIEADQKEKDRVNCSGSEDGIVILAREYRALKAENESLAPTNLGDAVLIAALKAENEALKKERDEAIGKYHAEIHEGRKRCEGIVSIAEDASFRLGKAERVWRTPFQS